MSTGNWGKLKAVNSNSKANSPVSGFLGRHSEVKGMTEARWHYWEASWLNGSVLDGNTVVPSSNPAPSKTTVDLVSPWWAPPPSPPRNGAVPWTGL
jgi:hypothetical protein